MSIALEYSLHHSFRSSDPRSRRQDLHRLAKKLTQLDSIICSSGMCLVSIWNSEEDKPSLSLRLTFLFFKPILACLGTSIRYRNKRQEMRLFKQATINLPLKFSQLSESSIPFLRKKTSYPWKFSDNGQITLQNLDYSFLVTLDKLWNGKGCYYKALVWELTNLFTWKIKSKFNFYLKIFFLTNISSMRSVFSLLLNSFTKYLLKNWN